MSAITDHHVHSEFSGDCNTPMEDIVERAIKLGLKEVMFTEHQDFEYPSKEICFEINIQEYVETIKRLKEKYKEIDILMGIEIGYQPGLNDKINNLLNSYPFDFVICSIHAWNGMALDKGHLFQGKTQKGGYREYFENLKYCVENFQNCDVYGHLDFIVRYGNFQNKILRYKDYKDIIDKILKTIINNGKGIELNTSGLRYNLNTMHPNKDILKRYFELGGKIVTLGSDAHRVDELGADFDIALKQLRQIGFTDITTFKNRKASLIKI